MGAAPHPCRRQTEVQRGQHLESISSQVQRCFLKILVFSFPRELKCLENTGGRDSKAATMCFAVRTFFLKESDAQVEASDAALAEGPRGNPLAECHLLRVDFGFVSEQSGPTQRTSHPGEAAWMPRRKDPEHHPSAISPTSRRPPCHLNWNFSSVPCENLAV